MRSSLKYLTASSIISAAVEGVCPKPGAQSLESEARKLDARGPTLEA